MNSNFIQISNSNFKFEHMNFETQILNSNLKDSITISQLKFRYTKSVFLWSMNWFHCFFPFILPSLLILARVSGCIINTCGWVTGEGFKLLIDIAKAFTGNFPFILIFAIVLLSFDSKIFLMLSLTLICFKFDSKIFFSQSSQSRNLEYT